MDMELDFVCIQTETHGMRESCKRCSALRWVERAAGPSCPASRRTHRARQRSPDAAMADGLAGARVARGPPATTGGPPVPPGSALRANHAVLSLRLNFVCIHAETH